MKKTQFGFLKTLKPRSTKWSDFLGLKIFNFPQVFKISFSIKLNETEWESLVV